MNEVYDDGPRSIAKLARALALAQAQIEGASKDGDNPHFRSKYATLASIWDACRGPLTSNGLSVVQMPGACMIDEHGARMALTTMLLHDSGEWVMDTMTVPIKQVDAQGCVAAMTYARKCALAGFAGVAPVDDDGEEAVGRGGHAPQLRAVSSTKKPAPNPGGKLGALRDQELAIFRQLAEAKAVERHAANPTPDGSLLREAYRVKWSGMVAFNPNNETDMMNWLQVLAKRRDEMLPPKDLLG